MKKYSGIKLKEVTEQQVFDPPKEMLVWGDMEWHSPTREYLGLEG